MKVGDAVKAHGVPHYYGERGTIIEAHKRGDEFRVSFPDSSGVPFLTKWFSIQELELIDAVTLLGEVADESR